MLRLPQDQQDSRRKILYLTLRYDFKRAEQRLDSDDMGKVIDKELKRRKITLPKPAAVDIKESQKSPDVGYEVEAILSTHPAWGVSQELIECMAEELEDLINQQVKVLKGRPEYKELDAAIKRRRTDATSVTPEQLAKLRDKVGPFREKMSRLLTIAYQEASDAVLAEFERTDIGQPSLLPALWNLALSCANTGDSGSPLVKAVLQFTTKFSELDNEFLSRVKFPPLASKFEAQGGSEVKAAIAKIREIAAKNPSPPGTSALQGSKATATAKSTASTTKATTAPKPAPPAKEMLPNPDSVLASKAAPASSKKRPVEEGSESSAPKKPATGLLQRRKSTPFCIPPVM